MKQFEDLATVFQVGTRRTETPGVPYLELAESSPERKALHLAGALGLMRRAGAEPVAISALDMAPLESARIATASATALDEALASGPVDAVLEWADKAVKLGKVAPVNVLPSLLLIATKHPRELEQVIGARGRWLAAAQGLDLSTPTADGPQDVRKWIAAEYESLDWKERVVAISGLAPGLSSEDEPILHTALGDRRKEVREAAANLVMRLPTSEAAKELGRLTEGLLAVEKSLLRKGLSVHAPDPATLPKWLPRTSSLTDFGPKALALFDLLRYTPPTRWSFGLPIEQVIDLAAKTDFEHAVREGLIESAIRFEHREWIDPLFAHFFVREAKGLLDWIALTRAVSDEAFERTVSGKLSGLGAHNTIMTWTLGQRKRKLSAGMSRTVVQALRTNLNHHYALREIAPFLDPSASTLLEEPLEDTHLEATRKHVHRTLDLRRRLLASLDQP